MANPKMLILRGNSAGPGSYPDETGNNNVAWPIGALHVRAASDYARTRGYEPVVLDKPGQPQSQHSPQAKAAIKAFLDDEAVAALFVNVHPHLSGTQVVLTRSYLKLGAFLRLSFVSSSVSHHLPSRWAALTASRVTITFF
jgi:hypothetical protein